MAAGLGRPRPLPAGGDVRAAASRGAAGAGRRAGAAGRRARPGPARLRAVRHRRAPLLRPDPSRLPADRRAGRGPPALPGAAGRPAVPAADLALRRAVRTAPAPASCWPGRGSWTTRRRSAWSTRTAPSARGADVAGRRRPQPAGIDADGDGSTRPRRLDCRPVTRSAAPCRCSGGRTGPRTRPCGTLGVSECLVLINRP